ncbi:lipopolysaccharide biosynthesis protein [Mammaliicoccus vitulinus]|uniref:lipopolysaccharide biosynthesis protein n=1 Tax=Mammaliicoccus vitulinus TaxID=71237 RepID=UPI001ADF00EB|nr:hypothetical protein [Mammaliicoccus vitulinus]QTN10576.1 hypothetical protein G7A42_01280 [Mammaliicoccus vitulinus]
MKIFKTNILLISFFTFLTLGSNFLLYRVANIYLDNDEAYGVWLVILSIITWFYIMDFGISNSLRNLLTEAVQNKDEKRISHLIYTTYLIMLIPLIILLLVGLIVNNNVNWSEILNVKGEPEQVNRLLQISFLLFPFVFYLNTISYIYHSFFKSYIVNILQFLNLFINCVVIYVLSFQQDGSVVTMGIIYFSINILVYLIATFYFFIRHKKLRILSFKNYEKKLIKPLLSMGISFFILDISSILLYNSGPLIISSFFNPIIAINFQLPYKLLTIFVTLSHIILTPLWTLIITQMTKKNYKEIKNVQKKLVLFLIAVSIVILIFTLFINKVIEIWIGKNYEIDNEFVLIIAILVILSIVCHTYQTLLKSMGKLYIQTFIFIIAIIVSFSCMFIFINVLNYDEYAFVISLILGLLLPSILLPISFNININRFSNKSDVSHTNLK